MSSDADADAAAVVDLFSSFYSETYSNVAVSVLFFYEALITFDREVRTAKWAGALLFFTNRYISMAVYVSALVQFTTFPSDVRFILGS
ncbi:hypothetical protein L226DRAFT_297617 [Lentinus tigrinus ALCF2SS1-7]|uniref:uncharacterized protein n=1 Tax=Lentinus tigrinus ALCF2SS1-7 TaxID=1328758 RepID=UPI001166337A|nr:hypothetical protein L226DRAFT_297617 [Lentinus tigrinus ALCF2SS1-7]